MMKPEVVLKLKEQFKAEMAAYNAYQTIKEMLEDGYAREALRAVIEEIFEEIKLHRLIAYVMEGNEPSIKLLEAVGFSLEGLCEKNLKVNGVWETHRLYGLLNPYEEC